MDTTNEVSLVVKMHYFDLIWWFRWTWFHWWIQFAQLSFNFSYLLNKCIFRSLVQPAIHNLPTFRLPNFNNLTTGKKQNNWLTNRLYTDHIPNSRDQCMFRPFNRIPLNSDSLWYYYVKYINSNFHFLQLYHFDGRKWSYHLTANIMTI